MHVQKFALVRNMHTVFYNSFHFTVSSHVCCFLFILILKCSTQLQRHAQSNPVASGWPSSSRPSVQRPASLLVSLPWPPASLRDPSSEMLCSMLVCNTLAAILWPQCTYVSFSGRSTTRAYVSTNFDCDGTTNSIQTPIIHFYCYLSFIQFTWIVLPIMNCGIKMHCAHHFILVHQFVIL